MQAISNLAFFNPFRVMFEGFLLTNVNFVLVLVGVVLTLCNSFLDPIACFFMACWWLGMAFIAHFLMRDIGFCEAFLLLNQVCHLRALCKPWLMFSMGILVALIQSAFLGPLCVLLPGFFLANVNLVLVAVVLTLSNSFLDPSICFFIASKRRWRIALF
jgi:hypothetical protein